MQNALFHYSFDWTLLLNDFSNRILDPCESNEVGGLVTLSMR